MQNNGNEACIRSVGPCAAMEKKSMDLEGIQNVNVLVFADDREIAASKAHPCVIG